mgnify:FL=1
MKQIKLKVSGGIVDPITIPKGVEVIIHDYDMVNTIDNELIQKDEEGKEFVEIIFEENEYA